MQDSHEHALARAFAHASPRVSPPATPWRSVLIHAAVLALWIVLFSRAFMQGSTMGHDVGSGPVWSWSVGVAYVLYDTVLLFFVGWQTLA
ncbi:MAG: hypothetical protein EOP20_03870, partial [Hyphomicrobiales bacterium]